MAPLDMHHNTHLHTTVVIRGHAACDVVRCYGLAGYFLLSYETTRSANVSRVVSFTLPRRLAGKPDQWPGLG